MPLILVVDDEEPVRMLLRDTLELDAYEVRDAIDGPEALESFDERRPDGVILDIMMPRMSGIDVLKEIRSRPGGAEVPVILLTAAGDDADDLGRLVGRRHLLPDQALRPGQPAVLGRAPARVAPRGRRPPLQPAGVDVGDDDPARAQLVELVHHVVDLVAGHHRAHRGPARIGQRGDGR